MPDYHKVGLLILREGRILLCRKKRGTSLLILPGGCIESGETHLACLEREVREELGDVTIGAPVFLGRYSDRAAGDGGQQVHIELYRGELTGHPVASSEVGELVWFGEYDDREQLAPSIRNRILPDLLARGIIGWRR
jgi:8-oxo-dGTP pyrophosphatase MutT (NUDIX family)